MKTFNTKLILALITTLVLTGCMPDSLTKFKKDAPTKSAATDTTQPPTYVDDNGNPVDPDSLVTPTKFFFVTEGTIPTLELPVGTAVELAPIIDGTLGDPATRSIMFLKCELVTDPAAGTTTTTLPPGLGFSQSDCDITGTPTRIYTNNGAAYQYTVQMSYKGENYAGVGTEELIKAHVKIGVYQAPTGLEMTQTNKLQISLNAVGVPFDSITSNTDSSASYDRYGVLTSSNGISGVVKYVDAANGVVGVNRSQPIVVSNVASIGSNEFVVSSLASGNKRGKIVSVNTTTKTVHIEPINPSIVFEPNDILDFVASDVASYVSNDAKILQPIVVTNVTSFAAGSYLTTPGGTKRGRIDSLNTTAKILYVDLLAPNVAFAANDLLDAVGSSVAPYVSMKSMVDSVITVFSFQNGEKIDNDKQYFSEKFNILKITQTFASGVAIPDVAPIITTTITAANGIRYTISPALPSGLSFSATTGKISGTFNSTMNSTAYTITASNSLGSSATTIHLAAINAPQDLSYTTRQLISVATTSPFNEGENLFQPLIAPSTTSVSAKILRKVSANLLSIDTVNGNFLSQATLDSGNAFYAVKSSVTVNSRPGYYNLAITLTDASLFTVGSFISGSGGHCLDAAYVTQAACTAINPSTLTPYSTWYSAKGLITNKVGNTLYVQFLTPSVTSSNSLIVPAVHNFQVGQGVDNAYPYSATETTIVEIEASNMTLTLSPNANNFTSGRDFTSNSYHSGYIYEKVGNNIKVDEINRTGQYGVQPAPGSNFLRIGDSLDNKEYYVSSTQSISAITHDNLIVIDRGVPRTIYANISQGTSLLYSVSPDLPLGMTLNPTTGVISGIATFMVPRQTYVVTATNLLSSAYYAFDMEVRDYFTFTDASKAKSFLTHKVGDFKTSRSCRINAQDILDGKAGSLDIGCNLEAEEMDLYYTALKLSAMVGPGICEYVSFTPYAFWQYRPMKTTRRVDVINDCTGPSTPPGATISGAMPTSANYCIGNYTNDGGPNCDTGSIEVVVWSGAKAGDPCTIETPTIVQCGGRKAACLAGPVTSVITSPTDLDAGVRSEAIEASAGLRKEWTIDRPYKFLDTTNIRNANSTISNQCSDSRADATKWANLQKISSPTISPFAKESPFYEFKCLDSAQDVKARIRLSVRDWDRSFKIKDNITELVPGLALPAADRLMNATGLSLDLGLSWNNNYDWDDPYDGLHTVATLACGDQLSTCSDPAQLNEVACLGAGGTWGPFETGSCSRASFTNRTDCEAGRETWTPSSVGSCHVGGVPSAHTTMSSCNAASGVWSLRDYPFPGDQI